MRFAGHTAWMLAAAAVTAHAPAARADDALDKARQAFVNAYDAVDYPNFCRVLDPDAAFHGALKDEWTFTADQIIKRFRAPCTCTQYAQDAKCGVAELRPERLTPFSIGSTTLKLSPESAPQLSGNQSNVSYALDSGAFSMDALPGKGQQTVGTYVILWSRYGNSWRLKHIDLRAGPGK